MTPLAHLFTKQLVTPKKDRTVWCPEINLAELLRDIHCFEMSAVTEIYEILHQARRVDDKSFMDANQKHMFLPAPKTWFEYKNGFGRSASIAIEEDGNPSHLHVFSAYNVNNLSWIYPCGKIDLNNQTVYWNQNWLDYLPPGLDKNKYSEIGPDPRDEMGAIPTMLAIINSPKIIGRRQHMPHRGLERALIAKQKAIGKFPLHGWTEIQLKVAPPKDMSGEAPAEDHLTGQKALHFCRAHLRVRMGRLEVVRAHWRGDAALGIKRSRYKVTA